jgi:hypothetical protein
VITFKAFPIESLSLDNEFQDFSSATETLYFFAMVDKDSPLFTLCVILTFWMVTAGAVLVEFVAGASTVGAVVLSFLAGIVGTGDGVSTEVASPESAAFSELVSRLIVLAEVSDEAEASVELGTEESKLLVAWP